MISRRSISGTAQLTMMKLLSQFEQVESATPLARRLDGNTSDGIALDESETIRIINPFDYWVRYNYHGTGPASLIR